MNTVKISVVLINYNCEKWLSESINSVLKQDWPDFELILIDDCSTDGSWAVMESFARRDSRVRLAKTPVNSGISIARNLGMDMATGAFIAFLDSDDVFLPDTLSAAHADFLRLSKDVPDLAMVMSDAWIVSEMGKRFGRYMPKSYWDRDIVRDAPNWTLPSTWFLKRESNARFFSGYRFGEASFFVERLRLEHAVAFVGRPSVQYRCRIHSATNEKAAEELRAIAATRLTVLGNRFDRPVLPTEVPPPKRRDVLAWKHGRTAKSAWVNGAAGTAFLHACVAAAADLPRFFRKCRRALLERFR